MPQVQKSAELYPHINLLLIVDTELSNFTAAAWMKDAVLGLKNLTKFNRVALVSDSEIVKGITTIADKVLPGLYKTFGLADEAAAISWISNSTSL